MGLRGGLGGAGTGFPPPPGGCVSRAETCRASLLYPLWPRRPNLGFRTALGRRGWSACEEDRGLLRLQAVGLGAARGFSPCGQPLSELRGRGDVASGPSFLGKCSGWVFAARQGKAGSWRPQPVRAGNS